MPVFWSRRLHLTKTGSMTRRKRQRKNWHCAYYTGDASSTSIISMPDVSTRAIIDTSKHIQSVTVDAKKRQKRRSTTFLPVIICRMSRNWPLIEE
mmetsp:Transcript_5554/g.12166  ORF Transcript_5554/g.12166 Transcript_5554/m.12166 type:complete len:95 (-) Transcript_5554:107-391(-)